SSAAPILAASSTRLAACPARAAASAALPAALVHILCAAPDGGGRVTSARATHSSARPPDADQPQLRRAQRPNQP
ncbi:MAG: hypothetical protein NZ701_07475, partial [Roseiflexus sp.]|nr:hypothetical protein [Roseiflexus sp.]